MKSRTGHRIEGVVLAIGPQWQAAALQVHREGSLDG